jgi:3-hydroxybutyrate dehydrogenase
MSLASRNAVVTGSTSGIGLAIARALAKEGANVLINGFGEAGSIEKERSGIESEFGVTCLYDGADMTRPAEIAAMVQNAEARLGSVDILVNNAGIQFVSPIEDFPIEKWDQIIAINMSSVFHAIRAATPGMKARKWGRIINTASAHSLVASPYKSAYVSAKHAVIGLTRTVAIEVAETPITVNAICPGFVRTPLAEAQVPPLAQKFGVSEEVALKDHLLVHQPSKRWIEVDEVASLALFLCGPGSSGITGAALPVDGGWTAA